MLDFANGTVDAQHEDFFLYILFGVGIMINDNIMNIHHLHVKNK